jgi:hypothetical protein
LNYLLAVAPHTIIAIPFKPFYLPGRGCPSFS